MRVFLSYRRGDVGGYAGRLGDELVRRLGSRDVFHDVNAITPGEDFTVAIERALDQSDVVLAVIGPTWLNAATADGTRRLFLPDDFVRLEVGRALARQRPVTPVLVGGATLPAAADLPEDLRPLANRQAVALHDETWHEDVEGLMRRLRGEAVVPGGRGRRRAGALAAAGVVGALAVAGWWFAAGGGGDGGGGDGETFVEPGACAQPDDGWTRIALADDPSGEVPGTGGPLQYAIQDAWSREQEPGRWDVILRSRMDNLSAEAVAHGYWHYDSLVVGRTTHPVTCFTPDPELVLSDTGGDALVGFSVACAPSGYLQLVLSEDRDRLDVTPDTLSDEC